MHDLRNDPPTIQDMANEVARENTYAAINDAEPDRFYDPESECDCGAMGVDQDGWCKDCA